MTLPPQIEFTLEGGPKAAGQAREELESHPSFVPPSKRAELLLLVTELVTNAVRHGGGRDGQPVTVVVKLGAQGLMAAVIDRGEGFQWSAPRPSRWPDTSGYGLLLVDRMARQWGIEQRGGCTTVWFELLAN